MKKLPDYTEVMLTSCTCRTVYKYVLFNYR